MANNSLVDLNGVAEIRDWVKANFLTIENAQQMMSSKLRITFGSDFVGQTYTITGGANETYTGTVPETMMVEQTIKTLSTNYIVTATNVDGGEFSRTIPVGNFYGIYSGKLTSFTAYLSCTSDANATITATSGASVSTGVADDMGACRLEVYTAGTYSVTATLNGQTTAPVSVEVTTMGETVDVTLPSLHLVIVSWADGTDNEIGAMLDAAKAGAIDLQTDGGWRVGDIRTIHIDSFRDGSSTTFDAQDVRIAISSFENYNESGSIMQFDFKDIACKSRMNPSNTNAGGYGATEMYKVTLPALVNALPEWLKSRLLEFSVLARTDSSSTSEVETVTGNKLALRSELEVLGSTPYSTGKDGTPAEYYNGTNAANRNKQYLKTWASWWDRSIKSGSTKYFCYITVQAGGNYSSASDILGVAPFGCI